MFSITLKRDDWKRTYYSNQGDVVLDTNQLAGIIHGKTRAEIGEMAGGKLHLMMEERFCILQPSGTPLPVVLIEGREIVQPVALSACPFGQDGKPMNVHSTVCFVQIGKLPAFQLEIKRI